MRGNMLEALGSSTSFRPGQGLRENKVIYRHALRNRDQIR